MFSIFFNKLHIRIHLYKGYILYYSLRVGYAQDTHLQVINVCLQVRFTLISVIQKSGRFYSRAKNILTMVLIFLRLISDNL